MAYDSRTLQPHMTMATKYYPFTYLLVFIPTTKFSNYKEDGYIIIL